MSYSVIYLENHECRICKEIGRNVIEPVVVFVPKEINKDTVVYGTCIFHCKKENEIWMGNYNEKWNGNLVNEFWGRIRAYRFAVDYKKKWDNFEGTEEEKWEQLKQLLPEETQKEFEEKENEKDKNKKFCIRYFFKLKEDELFYDFRGFVFPCFEEYFYDVYLGKLDKSIIQTINKEEEKISILKADKNLNFWYHGESLKFESPVDFWHSKFLDKFHLLRVIFKNRVDFSECKFFGDFNISYSYIPYFLCYETLFYKKADFIGCKFKDSVKIYGCKFYDNFDLSESEFDKEAKFLVYGYYDNKENKVEIQNLIINSIYNYSETIRFYGVKVKNLLKITNTSLKNFDFNNLDLTEAKDIVFRNVSFDNCILNNIHWGDVSEERINIEEKWIPLKNLIRPYISSDDEVETKIDELKEKITNNELTKENLIDRSLRLRVEAYLSHKKLETLKEEKIIELRDVYRQLKLALDKQEDHITANKFYALEMKAYEKYFEQQGWTKDNWQERLVFTIHKWVSNFGQSWTKPLMWLFTISFITSFIFQRNYYYCMFEEFKVCAEKTYWSYEKGFLTAMWEAVKLYFKILELILSPFLLSVKNIAEITKTIKGEFNESNLWIILFLFIYTVASGFLIYQFIVAVRRKVKR
ncbi:hypothetical protein [Persephonella sp. IF05-L8]|uniref:hypothetical protein n=1 Tax=Persephonella sp. IF05-L8 TaxID=1158338 RepID=UPI00049563AC